jgi:hypothetical protein
MSSLRRILSSRANGALSKGPKTAGGKLRSSANALRHGLLAKCVVLDNESSEGFESSLADFIARFQPADGVEFGIIEEMLSAMWRQRRAWAIETRLMNSAIAGQPDTAGGEIERLTAAFTNLAGQPHLELIHRYESRLHRMFQRALNNLALVRSAAAASEDTESPQGQK